jgi:putative hydrolase of the HAD superfamily
VTNNLLDEQQAKITLCGFDPYVDALIVSEVAGVSKPHPAIFRQALEAVGCQPSESVMVGDSWAADIEGARAAAIRPIWFNRSGRPSPDGSDDVREISTLSPIDDIMHAIFDADVPSDRGAGFRCASA